MRYQSLLPTERIPTSAIKTMVPQPFRERLEEIAAEERITLSDVVRRAIAAELDRLQTAA